MVNTLGAKARLDSRIKNLDLHLVWARQAVIIAQDELGAALRRVTKVEAELVEAIQESKTMERRKEEAKRKEGVDA